MKTPVLQTHVMRLVLGAVLLVPALLPAASHAQVTPPQRVIRTYIPPDQLVSFLPSTPFEQFVEFLNPIFQRVTQKTIVDPESHGGPIGIAISGMHFLDAFELVLEYNGLVYRETEAYFIIQLPEAPGEVLAGGSVAGTPAARQAASDLPATSATREVRINAVLFDMNHTRARELGIDWNALFGAEVDLGGSSDGQFTIRTSEIFEDLDEIIGTPDEITFSTVTQLFRFLETEGVGETLANPQISVQSGEQGRIQIGSDVPVQTRDFAGNTVTQFFSTGIIVDVTPTVIAEVDTAGATPFNFVHLEVLVEKSAGRPSPAGLIIDRNRAESQVLLLDGEQTVIGGLYSTEEIVSRRGIPLLKDLPGWFFGLRYLFSYNTKTTIQRELLIALQAEVVEPLQARAQRPLENELLEKRRQEVQETVDRFDERVGDQVVFPRVYGDPNR